MGKAYIDEIIGVQDDQVIVSLDGPANLIVLSGVKEAVINATEKVQAVLARAKIQLPPELIREVRGAEDYLKYMAKVDALTPASWTKFPKLSGESAKRTTFRRSTMVVAKDFAVKLDSKDAIYKGVEELVQKSWHGYVVHLASTIDTGKKINVTSVQRIENPVAYCDYMLKLKPLFESGAAESFKPITSWSGESEVHTATLGLDLVDSVRIPEVNEHFFFHGVKGGTGVVDAIISQGLEFRIAYDGCFGKGIYLAESVSKADQYAGGGKTKDLFIIRAPLGNIYRSESTRSFRRPPCMVDGCNTDVGCAHGKFYNSVLGKHQSPSAWNQFREFLIYENGLCYASYYVQYEIV